MYTLSHAFDVRLPVFVFDIGAQAERIASYPLGFPIPLHLIDRPLQILSLIREKFSI